MKNYQDVQVVSTPSVKVGIDLLDNLFSAQGGIEWSNLIFLTGTSGAGKTTFCKKLQSLIRDHKSLFYSREMLSSLVKKQTLRLDIDHRNAFISDCKDYAHFKDFMEAVHSNPDVKVLIIDSIQHVAADYVSSEGISLEAAMRLVYKNLMSWKDQNNGIVILIGQVTKDGDFQGANFLKHDADAHVHMTFDKKSGIRTIETTKNRMGKLDKLLYTIVDSEETMKFYTESQYESINKKTTIEDMLDKTIAEYIGSLDRKSVEFKSMSEEFNSYSDVVYSEYTSGNIDCAEYYGKVVSKIIQLKNKYFA
jgi:predicted ATP-dependent serine protease